MADDIYGESRVTAKSNNSTNDTLRQVSDDYVFCSPDLLMRCVHGLESKIQISLNETIKSCVANTCGRFHPLVHPKIFKFAYFFNDLKPTIVIFAYLFINAIKNHLNHHARKQDFAASAILEVHYK